MSARLLPGDHAKFDGLFKAASARLCSHGVSWLQLKAQAIVESNLKPDAVSPTGARGVMQFIKSTGAEYGMILDAQFFDAKTSIEAGARHMETLLGLVARGAKLIEKLPPLVAVEDKFERWLFALAAYNRGQGTLARAQDIALSRGLDATDWASVAHCYFTALANASAADQHEAMKYVARTKRVWRVLVQLEREEAA